MIKIDSQMEDIEWKKEWFPYVRKFPHSYWNSFDNRRKFLDGIKLKLKIKNPSDWGEISVQEFINLGGGTLLNRYKGSLFACLNSVYKGLFNI